MGMYLGKDLSLTSACHAAACQSTRAASHVTRSGCDRDQRGVQ